MFFYFLLSLGVCPLFALVLCGDGKKEEGKPNTKKAPAPSATKSATQPPTSQSSPAVVAVAHASKNTSSQSGSQTNIKPSPNCGPSPSGEPTPSAEDPGIPARAKCPTKEPITDTPKLTAEAVKNESKKSKKEKMSQKGSKKEQNGDGGKKGDEVQPTQIETVLEEEKGDDEISAKDNEGSTKIVRSQRSVDKMAAIWDHDFDTDVKPEVKRKPDVKKKT